MWNETGRRVAAHGLVLAGLVFTATAHAGSSYVNLHDFSGTEGGGPQAGLTSDGAGHYYFTTLGGGAHGKGGLMRMDDSGTVTVLHDFEDDAGAHEGERPNSDVLLGSDGALYGTSAIGGGTNNCGTLWSLDSAGVFHVLHAFAYGEGCQPSGRLAQSADGSLYGTALSGGSSQGVVWQYTPAGALNVLHLFAGGTTDGGLPASGVTLDAATGTLYGTTLAGGSTDNLGTIFSLVPGGAYTVMHTFGYTDTAGYQPRSAPVKGPDGNFYGSTSVGGTQSGGTLYRMRSDGKVTVLHAFVDYADAADGRTPMGSLLLDAKGNLFGTTQRGGKLDGGTVYRYGGGALTVLHSFGKSGDGKQPMGGVALDTSGRLIGVTEAGGANGWGMAFRQKAK